MEPHIRISIAHDAQIQAGNAKEKKEKVTEAFNAIAADLRRHDVVVQHTLWLTQEVIGSMPEDNLPALKKELAAKGFTVTHEPPPRKITPDVMRG